MIDYKTIISTTDSKVTLMQWLQALTEEFGDAKIKSVIFDVSTTRLSLTIQKEDGTAFTTTQVLYSLTADEQSLINNLIKSVTASSDGVTFSKAVSFQGNESHNGSEIHNGYASFLGDENHAGNEMHKGTATFTDLRSDDLTATDGQELMSWDGTTTALKGKADRPTYNGGDLALKSDVSVLYPSFQFLYSNARLTQFNSLELPSFLKDLDSYGQMFVFASTWATYGEYMSSDPVHFKDKNIFGTTPKSFEFTFAAWQSKNAIYLPNMTIRYACSMFENAHFTKILVEDGCTVKLQSVAGKNNYCTRMFGLCHNLTEIGAIDFGGTSGLKGTDYRSILESTENLELFHCTNISYSIDFSATTKMTESAMVEVFNNLNPVSTTNTLTFSKTCFALLTADDIAIATGKGWSIAQAS